MLIELVVLVPLLDNEGRSFSDGAWRELERRLLQLSGGLSKQEGITGTWLDEGVSYGDVSRQYTVAISSWRTFPPWLSIVEWAREEFRQVAMYIRVAGIAEILR